jgi:ubiquinone/menaquinone biosynthesis C-methylase UbiE
MPHICPWWLTFTFDNPLRRLLHEPRAMLQPFVAPGMHVADLGCGLGHFTLGLAHLVGPSGRVQAVDLQPESLARVRRRLERARLVPRVTLVQATADDLGLEGSVDFVLAFWMVHEVPDARPFFAQILAHLAPDGRVLVVEPRVHVSALGLAETTAVASSLGLQPCGDQPQIRWSRSVLLGRPAS